MLSLADRALVELLGLSVLFVRDSFSGHSRGVLMITIKRIALLYKTIENLLRNRLPHLRTEILHNI